MCETWKKGELLWLLDDFVKRCEFKLGQINEIFTGNYNGAKTQLDVQKFEN